MVVRNIAKKSIYPKLIILVHSAAIIAFFITVDASVYVAGICYNTIFYSSAAVQFGFDCCYRKMGTLGNHLFNGNVLF